jgi:hypothetical protein
MGAHRPRKNVGYRAHPNPSHESGYRIRRRPPYAPKRERGIFKTTDGGKTWTRSLFRDDRTGGVDLAMDAKNPDVLYAGFWEVLRTPHSLSSGGPGSGLFKSTDGGTTWNELTTNPGLPKPV